MKKITYYTYDDNCIFNGTIELSIAEPKPANSTRDKPPEGLTKRDIPSRQWVSPS